MDKTNLNHTTQPHQRTSVFSKDVQKSVFFSLAPRLCCLSPWVKQMHHFSGKKKSLLPLLPPIVPFPCMEVFLAIDFLPARALHEPLPCFLAGVISLCLSPFNCALLLWLNVQLPNWQRGEGCDGRKNYMCVQKFRATDFFLMQMKKKKLVVQSYREPF